MDKKKIKNENISREIKREIPDNIKVLYGKFYVFSFIYIFIFTIVYPFVLVNNIRDWASVMFFVLFGGFYIYMIVDVLKHKGRFNSIVFNLLILIVIMAMSFSIVKFLV